MKYVNSEEWEALKRHSARHLSDPHWLGGSHCVNMVGVVDRVELTTHQVVLIVRAPRGTPESR